MLHHARALRISVISSVLLLWTVHVASECFYPNGVSSNGSPCDRSAEVSACCGPGFVCLSNGLCQPGPDTHKTYRYQFYRSACTDRSWNSSACPQYCVDADNDLNQGQGLDECSTDNYCCSTRGDCCNSTSNIFHINQGSIAATIPLNTRTRSATDSSVTSSSTSASLQGGDSKEDGSRTVGIGVGVAVGVVALIVVVVVGILYLRRKRRGNVATKTGPEPFEMAGMREPVEAHPMEKSYAPQPPGDQSWTPLRPQPDYVEMEHVERHELPSPKPTDRPKKPGETYEMEG